MNTNKWTNLSEKEMQDINGGIWSIFMWALAYDILSNGPESASSFGKGFAQGSTIF